MKDGRLRVIYVDSRDWAFDYELQETRKLLEAIDVDGLFIPQSICDAIELRECWRLIHEADPVAKAVNKEAARDERFEELAKTANAAAMSFVSNYLKQSSLASAIGEARSEIELIGPFFCLLGEGKLVKLVSNEDFEKVLSATPSLISYALAYESIVKQFAGSIRRAMLANKAVVAEIVLNCIAVEGSKDNGCYLPKCLDNNDIALIFDEYCESEDPHINMLQIIANWKKDYGGYSLPSRLRYKAAKRSREIGSSLINSSSSVRINYGLAVTIDSKQKTCVKMGSNLSGPSFSFSQSWLEMTLDQADILTNLIYMFNLVDMSSGILDIGKPIHSANGFLGSFGVHGSMDFRADDHTFRYREMILHGFVEIYEVFLVSHAKSLEGAVNWFFNSYIVDEYGIEGFQSDMPDADDTYRFKCVTMSSEIERLAKEYHLYVRDGKIDSGLFQYESCPPFESIRSLILDKYAYGYGEDYKRLTHLLFSDQSRLSYLPSRKLKRGSFFELITHDEVAADEYQNRHLDNDLNWLAENGCISKDESGLLVLEDKSFVLHRLWEKGALIVASSDERIQEILKQGSDEGWVEYGSSLLSRSEADVFNYYLTDRKYANSLAVRNKYAHGAPLEGNPNADEFKRDYVILLACVLMLVLKINHELSIAMNKTDQLELIDWPWVEIEPL